MTFEEWWRTTQINHDAFNVCELTWQAGYAEGRKQAIADIAQRMYDRMLKLKADRASIIGAEESYRAYCDALQEADHDV